MRKLFLFLCAALMSVGMFATTVTWDSNTLSSINIYDGQSFTQDGVTVTSLIGMIYGETGQWMGNSNDASFKFSTSLGNFTKIEITATIHALGGSGWTQTSPGAVWTGEANETTFGEYVSSVSQIVFTIEEPAYADPNREYLSLDPSAWTWGYNSVSGSVEGGLQTTIISDWGAVSMGWDPERDLSEWDKIVFEVSHMDGCDGQWFKLKAYLRDASDSEGKQMEGLLGLDAPDNELNYLVIDLHQEVEGFDLTKARVLAVQCEPTGGIFTISSAYLLKEDAPAAKYYIVGNMTNWEVNENYEMNPSFEAETEEYFYGLDLTTTSEFKVVKVEGETKTWYPDGMGNNYGQNGEIERDGEYMIYFRPNMDGGEAWFYNCILAVRHAVAERVVMGFLFPENGMPLTGVKLIGSFEAGMLDLYLNSETGWYLHENVVAVDEDKFYLREAADKENFLLAFADGKWDIAEFIFDEVWEDDTWKDDPVKWVELDLSDNSKYAWANAIPEGVDNITADVKAVKVVRNGEVLILKNGKTFNLLGAEVK